MIKVNLTKAKEIAHEIRRAKREDEFAPLDKVVMLQLSGADEAEAQRTEIRSAYETMQDEIEAAKSTDEIKQALGL
jgi:hypothetical protein